MKNVIFMTLLIPLVLYAQEVFSSSLPNGSFKTPTLSTQNMNTNIPRLTNEFLEYNASLQAEMDNVHKNHIYNKYYAINQNPQNGNSLYQNNTNYNSPQIQQRINQQNEQLQKQSPFLQLNKQETPKWWRQENSYQGWGFN